MAGVLFVSQAMLDTWAEQGKIEFQGTVMTLLSGEGQGRRYALDPAVRFLTVLGAEKDPHALVSKVKSMAQLRSLGAEAMGDSVVLGDVAYEVQPGFLAEASAVQAAARAPVTNPRMQALRAGAAPFVAAAGGAEPPTAPPLPVDPDAEREEAEALARFLLKNLS